MKNSKQVFLHLVFPCLACCCLALKALLCCAEEHFSSKRRCHELHHRKAVENTGKESFQHRSYQEFKYLNKTVLFWAEINANTFCGVGSQVQGPCLPRLKGKPSFLLYKRMELSPSQQGCLSGCVDLKGGARLPLFACLLLWLSPPEWRKQACKSLNRWLRLVTNELLSLPVLASLQDAHLKQKPEEVFDLCLWLSLFRRQNC